MFEVEVAVKRQRAELQKKKKKLTGWYFTESFYTYVRICFIGS